ncbi:MAG TPA: dihydrofolate reductase family protein [Actinocrinis sp.]|nr:dihydrofolate reductase family protein [Actinocrinis sp.]
MGRIVVTEFVSLDGVMADPGGSEQTRHGGWTFQFDRGDAGNAFKMDELMAADALLLGRTTYDGFAAAWPGMGSADPFTAKMNSIRKYVVSSTLSDEDATWENTRVVRGDAFAELARLRAEPGGDLLVAGSGQLVAGLMERGLVDEFRLMVFPIVLGEGRRLFEGSADAAKLTLGEVGTAGDGVLLLTYHPADKA